jgi:hypothetical protein
MKSGDNAWSAIDLVSDKYEDKMDTNFMPDFFTSLKEFSLSITPVPKHFLAWVCGHGYFKNFEKALFEKGTEYILGHCNMFYTRILKENIKNSPQKFHITEIKADEFSQIKNFRELLAEKNLLEFADIMDFNINNFGSPILKETFKQFNHPFKRQYYKINFYNEFNFLLVLTLVPEGQNPGRWIDSIFLFDLNNQLLPENEWNSLKHEIIKQAGKYGYSTHAIRRMVNKENSHHYPNEIARLTSFVLHPKAFNYFR